jgi:hypothetical protein
MDINSKIDIVQLHKMAFIYNALENDWSVKKKDNKYIFRKNHQNQKEVYLDDYLKKFIKDNININDIFTNNLEVN